MVNSQPQKIFYNSCPRQVICSPVMKGVFLKGTDLQPFYTISLQELFLNIQRTGFYGPHKSFAGRVKYVQTK